MLFREQGITITSILMAIGMAIGVLVEALLPSSGTMTAQGKVVVTANQRTQRMAWEQTENFDEAAREIRHDSGGIIAWHH